MISTCCNDASHRKCLYSGQVFPECRLEPLSECLYRKERVPSSQVEVMHCVWRRPTDTCQFPPTGQHVYCYVRHAGLPYLSPAHGVSTGYSIVPTSGVQSDVLVWWLDGLKEPVTLPVWSI